MLDGVFNRAGKDGDRAGRRRRSVAVIACGALSHELQYLRTVNGWDHVDLFCLDAGLHNRPQQIPARLQQKIAGLRGGYESIFVAYADCGTGGAIDAVLAQEGVERLPGPHCYSFYAGEREFAHLAESEPATYYLTDFLAAHFERLVIRGLKLDRYPQLRDDYFGNYTRVLYLSQRVDEALLEKARAAAGRLGLQFVHRHCGHGELESALRAHMIAVG